MSEIRVDTISEKTSANGVAIDSVTLKDGGATLTDNITFSASGKGVHLGVTSATASNLLDDYRLLHQYDIKSGSIAQVHIAICNKTNKKVAIKCIHPYNNNIFIYSI